MPPTYLPLEPMYDESEIYDSFVVASASAYTQQKDCLKLDMALNLNIVAAESAVDTFQMTDSSTAASWNFAMDSIEREVELANELAQQHHGNEEQWIPFTLSSETTMLVPQEPPTTPTAPCSKKSSGAGGFPCENQKKRKRGTPTKKEAKEVKESNPSNSALPVTEFPPSAARRSKNPYIVFCEENRVLLQQSGKASADVERELGLMWKHLDTSKKQFYVNKARQVQEQIAELYRTNPDQYAAQYETKKKRPKASGPDSPTSDPSPSPIPPPMTSLSPAALLPASPPTTPTAAHASPLSLISSNMVAAATPLPAAHPPHVHSAAPPRMPQIPANHSAAPIQAAQHPSQVHHNHHHHATAPVHHPVPIVAAQMPPAFINSMNITNATAPSNHSVHVASPASPPVLMAQSPIQHAIHPSSVQHHAPASQSAVVATAVTYAQPAATPSTTMSAADTDAAVSAMLQIDTVPSSASVAAQPCYPSIISAQSPMSAFASPVPMIAVA